ncbi:MAG: zinc ribbon domain-containing protein [Nostoc sp. ChiSLP01]|nr:zinc ribbon domain-containing protein [Nostoc sp. CmiSLP01]MDZ8284297.1 zinc ribbon domain-containing protein [Nostoc sp. ChiSLP01]
MQTVQNIYCPNCGSKAERYFITDNELTRTQCPSCDYLMISCTRTGKVVEAYAPGILARR